MVQRITTNLRLQDFSSLRRELLSPRRTCSRQSEEEEEDSGADSMEYSGHCSGCLVQQYSCQPYCNTPPQHWLEHRLALLETDSSLQHQVTQPHNFLVIPINI